MSENDDKPIVDETPSLTTTGDPTYQQNNTYNIDKIQIALVTDSLPSPSIIREWREIVPDAGPRFLAMGESLLQHKQDCEVRNHNRLDRALEVDLENRKHGRAAALIFLCVLITAGTVLVLFDKSMEAFIGLITASAVVGISKLLVDGKSSDDT